VHLIGFNIRIYHDAQSSEYQIQRMSKYVLILFCLLRLCIFMSLNQILQACVIFLVQSARYDRFTRTDLNTLISGERTQKSKFLIMQLF
jgi:hypothetical protein